MSTHPQTHYLRITLREPAMFSQSGATVDHRTHDWIAGRVLLGLAAKRYDAFAEPTRIFHGGAVTFGDGFPLAGRQGRIAWPTPRALHVDKYGGPTPPWWNLAHEDAMREAMGSARGGDTPPPQLADRKGTHTAWLADGTLSPYTVPRVRMTKTAIKPGSRGLTQDGNLFTREAVGRGQRFVASFTIHEALCDADRALLMECLIGEHTLGASRNGQYGRCRIEEIGEEDAATLGWPDTQGGAISTDQVTVWLLSRVALRTTDGRPRRTPEAADFGLGEGWAFCPARSFTGSAELERFNGHRRSFSLREQVLERGSVLVFTRASAARVTGGLRCAGELREEGLGMVWVQPDWATKTALTLANTRRAEEAEAPAPPCPDAGLASWLSGRTAQIDRETRTLIMSESEAIVQHTDRRAPNAAQWSTLRQWALQHHPAPVVSREVKQALGVVVRKRVNQLRPAEIYERKQRGETIPEPQWTQQREWGRGWERPSHEQGQLFGDRVAAFGAQHGALALAELAHLVRARLQQKQRREA